MYILKNIKNIVNNILEKSILTKYIRKMVKKTVFHVISRKKNKKKIPDNSGLLYRIWDYFFILNICILIIFFISLQCYN